MLSLSQLKATWINLPKRNTKKVLHEDKYGLAIHILSHSLHLV